MRVALALSMTLMLLSIVSLCPLMACPMMAAQPAHHCGHGAPSHSFPCPAKSVQNCPYFLLEKSKATSNGAQTIVPPLTNVAQIAPALLTCDPGPAIARVADFTELYLRNRTLLI